LAALNDPYAEVRMPPASFPSKFPIGHATPPTQSGNSFGRVASAFYSQCTRFLLAHRQARATFELHEIANHACATSWADPPSTSIVASLCLALNRRIPSKSNAFLSTNSKIWPTLSWQPSIRKNIPPSGVVFGRLTDNPKLPNERKALITSWGLLKYSFIFCSSGRNLIVSTHLWSETNPGAGGSPSWR